MKRIIQRTAALIVGLLLGMGAWAGLETVTHISDLNASWPLGSDLASTSDDHIRNIKTALKNDFPNINAAVTGTPTQLNTLTGFLSGNSLVLGSGSVTAQSFIPSSSTVPANGIYLPSANSIGFSTNSVSRGSISNQGTWSISTPTSGTAFAITSAAASLAAFISNGPIEVSNNGAIGYVLNSNGSNYGLIQNDSANNWSLGTGTSTSVLGTPILKWNATGNVVVATPSTGTALVVNGFAGSNTQSVIASTTSSQSFGLFIQGGSNSSDYGFEVNNSAGTTNYFKVRGDGAIQGAGPVAGALVDMTPDNGTFTATYTGMSTTITCTANWSRIGKLATLSFCSATGTSNASTFTMTGLPSAIQPATVSQHVLLVSPNVTNNGIAVATFADATITAASGTVTFSLSGNSSGWNNTGNKGISSNITVSYLLN